MKGEPDAAKLGVKAAVDLAANCADLYEPDADKPPPQAGFHIAGAVRTGSTVGMLPCCCIAAGTGTLRRPLGGCDTFTAGTGAVLGAAVVTTVLPTAALGALECRFALNLEIIPALWGLAVFNLCLSTIPQGCPPNDRTGCCAQVPASVQSVAGHRVGPTTARADMGSVHAVASRESCEGSALRASCRMVRESPVEPLHVLTLVGLMWWLQDVTTASEAPRKPPALPTPSHKGWWGTWIVGTALSPGASSSC